jgi:hypothetical protein
MLQDFCYVIQFITTILGIGCVVCCVVFRSWNIQRADRDKIFGSTGPDASVEAEIYYNLKKRKNHLCTHLHTHDASIIRLSLPTTEKGLYAVACLSHWSALHPHLVGHTTPNNLAQQIHIFKIDHMHQEYFRTLHTSCLLIIHDSSRPLHQSIGDDASKRPPCLHRTYSQDISASVSYDVRVRACFELHPV